MPNSTTVPHFFRLFRGDTVEVALARHRQYLWSQLSLKPGMRVLEIGSGYGTAAMELYHFAGVSVVGIDNDSSKVEQSLEAARSGNLQDGVTFMKVDFLRLSQAFEPNTFDAVYAIESLKIAPSFLEGYKQVQHVLKPGGKIAIYDWCWTNTFDSNDMDHCRLASLVEDSINIEHRDADERSIQGALTALESTRFQVLAHTDLASLERAYITPWYVHLRDALGNPNMFSWKSCDRTSRYSVELTRDAAYVLQQAGVSKVPEHTPKVAMQILTKL